MKTSGTEEKAQVWIHKSTPTWFLTKEPKTYDGENAASSTKCYWENWISACIKLKLLSPCPCINSKWIQDLNIRPETLKLMQERAGNTLELISTGNNFLNGSSSKGKDWQMGLHETKKLVYCFTLFCLNKLSCFTCSYLWSSFFTCMR
jgi:hypothetical protein